jgi:hypothetical protein
LSLTGSAGIGEQVLEQRIPAKMKIGELVVLVDDVDGGKQAGEGCIMGARDDMVTVGCQSRDRLHFGPSAHLADSAPGALSPFKREGRGVNE